MLDHRRVAAQPQKKREQLFTERYESLLAWAMRLTNHQRDIAEDLVQDAFVQFMQSRTKLEDIGNIDGYLNRMLRYMYFSRISRPPQPLLESTLPVEDNDASQNWAAGEPSRRVHAAEDLYQLCAYACARKESSKAGSVLILRFFLDYFPIEIARVLNTSRHCVDEWQRLARREAKLFMTDPQRLRAADVKSAFERHIKYLKSDCELMFGLRRMIFDSCSGECLSQQEFAEVYSNGSRVALATPKLAHVVSCRKCLDSVNRILELPLVAEL